MQVTYDVSVDSDGTVVISLAGELDIESVPVLQAGLAPTMAGRPRRVVVDASVLEFADSSAIALLVQWAHLVRQLELHDPASVLQGHILRMGLADRIAIGVVPNTSTPEPA